jgi:glycosyltransferase involved in cell wall biosynthesis
VRVALDLTPARMNPAGTGRYARAMLAALPDAGVEVVPVEATRRRPGHVVGRVALGLWREAAWYPAAAEAAARRAGAALLHVPAPLGPPRPRGPVVLTIHDVLPLRQPELFTGALLAHARHVLPVVARAAALVLTGSEHARSEIVALLGVPEARVAAIPYGVDPVFSPRAVDDDWLAGRFGLRRPYVLCTGTLEPRKNLRAVLEVLPGLPDDVTLAVAGGQGWQASAIESALAAVPGRVRRLGYVTDEELARLYSGAACFVFPSLSEGFGFPPLEAMACGAPVVSSDRTSLPEVVGEAGLLVDPEDRAALTAAVRRVLEDGELASALRARGREQAARFSWARTARRTAERYSQLVASRQ